MGTEKILPLQYGDPFYRGCGRGCGRGRGWLHEDIPGRNLDGRGRFPILWQWKRRFCIKA